jgi:HTH-type transcriptional regulator / antitoxin HipB
MKTRKNTTTFEEFLDEKYGKKGTHSRDKFEQGFEVFKLGAVIEETRKRQKMTQEQLAKKCSTTKNYISRIENGDSDIRLSTLLRIIHQGLGGRLKLTIELDNKVLEFDL